MALLQGWAWLAGLAMALFIVIVLLVVWSLRRRRFRPSPPLSAHPSSDSPTVGLAPPEASPLPPPGTPYLQALGQHPSPLRFPLDKEVVHIGRADDGRNDLVIDQSFAGWQTVSREHARLERDGDVWIVVDLGSDSGVYVDGYRTGQNILRDGCTVSFGQVGFLFRLNQGGPSR